MTLSRQACLAAASLLALVACRPSSGVKHNAPEGAIPLVRDHRAVSAVILPAQADPALRDLAQYFVATVQRSTRAEIPTVSSDKESALPPETTRIFIGPSPQAEEAGLRVDELPEEGYRIAARNGRVFLLGRDASGGGDAPVSRPTRWAINRILEEQLGVRWLWPGDLGTFVPKHADLAVPAADAVYQPHLLLRRLRITSKNPIASDEALNGKLKREAALWAENHQAGQRGGVRFGHAFEDWWGKYGKDHPDYFAEPPQGLGLIQPVNDQPGRVKLRLSNPRVIEQIAAEYQAAGAPDSWNVCPNDGGGFDVSEATLAWDIPKNQSPEAIWNAKGNLTARYVTFWNLLHARLKQINPNVKLATYAYHSYKTPPPAEAPLTAKTAIAIVPGYKDYELWKGWAVQPGTAQIFLRPNWGHIGANAPYLPLDDMARFLKFAWENKMAGFDLDSVLGFWATQGTNYYLWARLSTRPDLSAADILDEYCSAFGAGAPKIRAYFDYWQRLTTGYAYPETYAASDPDAEKGKFAQLLREGKTELNFVRGPRYALPYLYDDEALRPAYALLDEAHALIGQADAEAAARVAFLRGGLDELRGTRDLIALSRQIRGNSSPELVKAFHDKARALESVRESLTPGHAVWGARITAYEEGYRVPMWPRHLPLPTLNMDGL